MTPAESIVSSSCRSSIAVCTERKIFNSFNKRENKLLLYEAILKPIRAYGVQLWGAASNSNIEILQRFQNIYLGIIVNVAWYVTNDTLHHDLNVPYFTDEIKSFSQRYADRLEEHPNILANFMRN